MIDNRPAQIKAKLEAGEVLWNAKIEALRHVGLEVIELVKRKDVETRVKRVRSP